MLHFICGRIRSGKTSYVIDKIKECKGKETLFIVPEQYSHSMERLLCESCGNGITEYASVTSFRRLGAEVKAEVGGVAAEIVGGGRRVLMLHSAISETSAELSALAKTARRPERLGEILAAIDEFKAYGISPEAIAKVSDKLSGRCRAKLCDLALIYAAYEKSLGEDSFDGYDELDFISEKIRETRFFDGKVLFFDGFSGFTASEFDIIASAISDAKDVYITLETDDITKEDKDSENGIFDKVFDTKGRIIGLCERAGGKYDEVFLRSDKKDSLHHLDRALFADFANQFDGVCDNITVARADSVFEECELAAAYILDSVRERGMRYRDFSVAVTSGDEYLRTCEMVFSRYGIPVYVAAAREIVSNPAVAVILSAFDCILRGFKTDAVMDYIKTGFSGIGARSLDIFENYLYTWNPKPSAWRAGDFTKNPLGLGKQETPESRELLRIVNRVKNKIYEPIERLQKAVGSGKSGEKCAEALFDFINDIKIPRRCNAYAYISEVGGRLREAQEYSKVMDILCDAIDSIGRVAGDEKIELEELYLLFKIVISQYELDTIPASLDCVTADELVSADGGRARVRMILGANDGSLPSSGESSGILSDNDREELSGMGIELAPRMTERVFEQYRTVHNVICSGEEALYISSCATGEGGKDNPEAGAVKRIREVFGDVAYPLSVHEARLRARVPCFDESVASGNLGAFENNPTYGARIRRIKENASGKRGPIIKRENIDSVFGKRISMSASRADLFCSCRYAYFLRYGLYAKPRERAEISAIEAGTLMHDVLEKVIARLCNDGDFSLEPALGYAREACREYIENFIGEEGDVSGRMEFILKRLEKTVEYAVRDICRELEKSDFRPSDVELKFKRVEGDLPEIEIHGENSVVALNGAVDRIDTYEKDGKIYFRVIDYKSGKKEFSLDATVNGIGMQMLLYMFAVEEMGRERFGGELHPAGVMYIPISRAYSSERGVPSEAKKREGVILRDMDIIEAMEHGAEKEYIPVSIDKKTNGLKSSSSVLSKREFDAVKTRMKDILAKIGDELCDGEIEPNPYEHKGETACRWCDYRSVCAFDEERTDDRMRELCEVKASDVIENAGGEDVE